MLILVAEPGHPASLEAEDLIRLAAGRNGQDDVSFQCRHLELSTQHGRVQIYLCIGVEVISLPIETIVGENLDIEVEVASAPSATTGLPRETDPGSRSGAGWDLDIQLAARPLLSLLLV